MVGTGNPFTYPAWDLMTLTPRDTLPYYNVQFGQQENSPGPWSGSLAISDPAVTRLDWQSATLTGRTFIGVDYRDELIWGGIIWTHNWDDSVPGQPLAVQAAETGSYFASRTQAKDYSVEWTDLSESNATTNGTPVVQLSSLTANASMVGHVVEDTIGSADIPAGTTVLSVDTGANTITMSAPATSSVTGIGLTIVYAQDPLVISQQVVTDALARTNGNPVGGITVRLVYGLGFTSAPPIDAQYPGTQVQTLQSILSTLTQMGYTQGYDYSFDVQYEPGVVPKQPMVTLTFWFPRQGRQFNQSRIVIPYRQTTKVTYGVDSTPQANEVIETGSGSGGIQPATALDEAPAGYPLLQKTINHVQVNTEAVLINIAANDLGYSIWPICSPTVTIPIPLPDENGRYDESLLAPGGFLLGDDMRLDFDAVAKGATPDQTLNQSPRFPDGASFVWRCTNWTAVVADKGVPTILFDLGLPPVETIPPPMPPL